MRDTQQGIQALFFPYTANGVWRLLPLGLCILSLVNLLVVFSNEPNNYVLLSCFCTIVYSAEYLARLMSIPKIRPSVSPAKARLLYSFSFMGLLDLFSAIAPLLFLFPIPVAEVSRIVALVRFVKIGRYTRGLRMLAYVFRTRKDEIIAAFVLLAILTISASVAMYEVEHVAQPFIFNSPFSGLYWAMTTITTTGYGDMVPITAAGKVIGFCTMVLSIAVVAVPAGIFSAGFVDTYRKFKDITGKDGNHKD